MHKGPRYVTQIRQLDSDLIYRKSRYIGGGRGWLEEGKRRLRGSCEDQACIGLVDVRYAACPCSSVVPLHIRWANYWQIMRRSAGGTFPSGKRMGRKQEKSERLSHDAIRELLRAESRSKGSMIGGQAGKPDDPTAQKRCPRDNQDRHGAFVRRRPVARATHPPRKLSRCGRRWVRFEAT